MNWQAASIKQKQEERECLLLLRMMQCCLLRRRKMTLVEKIDQATFLVYGITWVVEFWEPNKSDGFRRIWPSAGENKLGLRFGDTFGGVSFDIEGEWWMKYLQSALEGHRSLLNRFYHLSHGQQWINKKLCMILDGFAWLYFSTGKRYWR